ncbi:hypothetical protein, partial [Geofilum rubicundum]|uniref:hypothetical protein n=1 Tax=Geofilum rubicundum TaxID=472113 RepID=UPI0012F73C8F
MNSFYMKRFVFAFVGLMLGWMIQAQTTYYALVSGDWNNSEVWTLDPAASIPSNPNNSFPKEGDNVVIKTGRTITLNGNGIKANVVTVDGRLETKQTSGHQFFQIRGSGRIIMEADNFPAGDASHFISKNQGEGTAVFSGGSYSLLTARTFYNMEVALDAGGVLAIGANLNLNGNLEVRSGMLRFGNSALSRSLTIQGNVFIASNASITVANSNATHQFEVYGNLENNGHMRLTNLDQPTYNNNPSTGSVTLVAKGASNTTFSTNSITFLHRLIVDKGTDRTYRLTLYSSTRDNFRLFGRNNNALADKALYIKSGTLELTGDLYLHSLTEGGSDFTIPLSGGLWINGPNVEVNTTAISNDADGFTSVGVTAAASGSQSFSVKGHFKITDGTLNTHTHGFVAWDDGNALVEVAGGKIKSPGFRSAGTQDGKWSYNQSGGEVILYGDLGSDLNGSGVATFSVKGEDNIFIMSGGILEIQDAATNNNLAINIESGEGKSSVTGGTVRIKRITGAGANFNVVSSVPFYNFVLDGEDATTNVVVDGQLNVLNDLAVGAGTSFDATGCLVSVGRHFDITGDFIQNSDALQMIGSGDGQIINNRGSLLELNALILDKNSLSNTVSLSGGNINIEGDLTLKQGFLELNNRDLFLQGDFTLEKGSVISSGSGKTILNGTSGAQTIFSKYRKDFSFGVVELANNIQLNSHSLLSKLSFSGNYIVDLGVFNLEINVADYSAEPWGSTRMFRTAGNSSDGGLTLPVLLNGNYSNTVVQRFPVGTSAGYTPMEVQARNALQSNGTITVSPVNDYHPTVADEQYALDYFWRVSDVGLEDVEDDIRYMLTNYEDFNIPNYVVWPFTNAPPEGIVFYDKEWNNYGDNVEFNNRFLRFPYNAPLSKDFSFGVLDASFLWISVLDPPRTLYSRQTGNFGDRNTWSTTSHTGGRLGNGDHPRAIDYCIIHPDHEVTIDGNGARASQVEVNGSLIVNEGTTGHFIDIITGSGRLVYNDNTLINGDHTEFCNNASAIFEYAGGRYELPVDIYKYPNLHISGNDRKTLGNVDLEIVGNLKIDDVTIRISPNEFGDLNIAGNLEVNGPDGLVQFRRNGDPRIVQIDGDIVLSESGRLSVQNANDANPNLEHILTLFGSVDIKSGNMSLYHHNVNTHSVKVLFEGDQSVTVDNNGTLNFGNISIKKGPDNNVHFRAPFNLRAPADRAQKALELVSGTAWLDHDAIDLTLTSGGNDFRIPSTASIIVDNGATVKIDGDDTGIWLDGLLKIDNGASALLNGGTNNYIEYSASGNAEIWVGNTDNVSPNTLLNVGSQIRRGINTDAGVLKLTQDKAATDILIGADSAPVSNRGVLELMNEGSAFTQNEAGSFITIAQGQENASVPALIFDPTAVHITTGSGFRIGDGTSAENQTMGLFMNQPLKNLEINLPSSSKAQFNTVGATLEEDLAILAGELDANGLDVILYGDLVNNGIYNANFNTTYFRGNSAQTINGDVALYNVVKQGAATLLQDDDSEVTVENTFRIEEGVVNTADNQLIVRGDLLIEEGASTQSSETSDGIVMAGSNSQLLQGGGDVSTLTIDNPAGVVVPTQGGALTFTSQLKLNEGVFDIGRNLLVIGKDAEIVSGAGGFSESTMVQTNLSFTDAGVQKFLPSISSAKTYTIPIGSMGKYTPVGMNISSNGNDTGSIRIKAANEAHITIPSSARNRVLQYNWTLDAEGIEDFTSVITMQGNSGDIAGDGEQYITARLLNASEGLWNKYTKDDFDGVNYTLSFTFENTNDAGIDGDFTAGEEDAIPDKVQTFVTRANGPWNSLATWMVEGGAELPAGGPRGAIVQINHEVSMTDNGYAAYLTELGADGVLYTGTTFGHRLGRVKGNGRLVTEREALPAGEYGQFFSEQGGTLEYAGTSSYDVLGEIPQVNNLALSGAGDRRLPALDLILTGDLTVDGANMRNESATAILLKGDLLFESGRFDNRTAKLTFGGTEVQNVAGSRSLSGIDALYLAEVDNPAGIALSNDLEVSNSMAITNGNVYSENSSSLLLSNSESTALTISNSSNFIGTILKKQMTTGSSWVFNVGRDSRKGALAIDNVSATGIWEVEYFDAMPTDRNNRVSPLVFISSSEYWRVKAPEDASANITLRWDANSGINPEEESDLRGAQYLEDGWNELLLDPILENGDGGTASIRNPLSFNAFGFGNYLTFGTIFNHPYTWTGATSSDWFTASNWTNNSVPSASANTTISAAENLPEISGDDVAHVNDLTIENSSSLTLKSSGKLTVNGDLTIAATGELVLDNGYGVNGMASLIAHGQILGTGSTRIRLTTPPNQWFYLGSSVQDAVFSDFSAGEPNIIINVYRANKWWGIKSGLAGRSLRSMEGIVTNLLLEASSDNRLIEYTGELHTGPVSRI